MEHSFEHSYDFLAVDYVFQSPDKTWEWKFNSVNPVDKSQTLHSEKGFSTQCDATESWKIIFKECESSGKVISPTATVAEAEAFLKL